MHSLLMPFVVCASQQGPYDDESFVAGYTAGQIDTTLRYLQPVDGTVSYVVRPALVPQLDLLAMRYGYKLIGVEWDDDVPEEAKAEWVHVVFERSPSDAERSDGLGEAGE